MIIQKFGGTSLGTPERMQSIAHLIANGERKVIVLSAVSGTTNTLVEVCTALHKRDEVEALLLADNLESLYKVFIEALFSKTTEPSFKEETLEIIEAYLQGIRSHSKKLFSPFIERSILAQGELISTNIFHQYLKSEGKKSVLLNALDFMRTDSSGEPDQKFIEENLQFELSKHPKKNLFICQGYICRNAFGEIDNLKRGGSDYSASLIGAAINAKNIQIWTDIDGMHNNDPRIVDNTKPIKELSFKEAAELAYFGAKILHPASIRPAEEKNIPVWLKNTLDSNAHGTLIHAESLTKGFKAVAAKEGIIAIKIRSGRMLMAYGFLRNVFEVFERFKTPIDMITTSEVAVSVTIDNVINLEGIVKELKNFGSVEVDQDQTIVCVVGNYSAEGMGYASKIFTALDKIPIRMISYGGSNHNVSVLIKTEQKKAALMALNKGVFNL
jgi:aspartate kinase|tara:strand:- start:12658 stop:13983 length:1326 start_codon:yes stop_codon:yes gene_type:complete